jgi:hypothetical protein
MAPWWLRHFRREILAGLGILSVLIGLVLLYRFIHVPRPEDDRPLEGRIVGFHGVLVKSQMRNLVLASVRLPDGRIANVPMPRSGRAAHCREGDRVRLVRNGVRLRIAGDGCDRR